MKKPLKVYYLLACEGYAEYIIFSYLTKNKFRKQFSRIKFSDRIRLTQGGIDIISGGKLNGVGDKNNFISKYSVLKEKYSNETFF